ncbi:hypothetical protein LA303_00070 [Candidatus Sulfidibacterium hydrothermale]|uniref:hypothetical protein n=1 Tax=Candidatus Sulfidibacterium hydrothermale TaxID=2875962 RepID=UPI001F0AA39B|nr:hypothetical protein [Candidatus Sulfidibacterium hydrothermale]UBM62396.1 hypothetical protein LA303_00070 [Candidatus Sulfidibacterium hydrothermale]
MKMATSYQRKISILLFATVLFFFGALPAKAQTAAQPTDQITWHGYAQFWTNTDFDNSYTLSLRRLKFWIGSGPAFSEHWSFKVQALFTSLGSEKFFLQDVYGEYRNLSGNSSIRFGQFVPKYSLQRFQHDYQDIPLERAAAINITIPDGTLGVRDIGAQYTLRADHKRLEMNVGFFNGYGIKEYRANYTGYMFTHNLSYTLQSAKWQWKLGYSVMYRKAEDLSLKYLLPDSVLFSGNDFRCDIYALLKGNSFSIQAEYLNTWLNGNRAYGYYALTSIKINKKNEVYLSYDKYNDLISTTENNPWYIAGYNFRFKGDNNLVLTLDTRFRKENGSLKNLTSVQFQIFFH